MGQLADYSIDQIAGAAALLLGSLGALLHVIFQSRCTRISLCCGFWSCDRRVPAEAEAEEENDAADAP
eukprot:COSAG05_NODE_2936_length_2487_cov_31.407035_3_plen_68_part_00